MTPGGCMLLTLNESESMSSPHIATVICALNEYGDEAVYIEGQLVREDGTIYMGELIKAIERRLPAGQPIRISQMVVKNETWPKAAEDLELAAAGKSQQ